MTTQVFKNNQNIKWKIALKSLMISMILSLVFTSVSFAEGGGRYTVDPWAFGVMGDTQWTLSSSTNPDPNPNPEYVSADVANALNLEFIYHDVKFAIQVGDLTDRAGDAGMYARADAAQPLFDAGIGFFPLRGNHEVYGSLYGRDPNNDLNIPAYLDAFPQTQGLDNTYGAMNFSSPSDVMTGVDVLDGLSYSFDYGDTGNKARFVIVDVEENFVDVVTAPYNPQSCVDAITPGTPAGTTPFCGQGYLYFLNDWLPGYDTGMIVYQATHDITNGVTTTYDSAANPVLVDEPITITAGTWFRIASSGNPSTDWRTWNEAHPDQMWGGNPFDIVAPVADPGNREMETSSSSGSEIWPGGQQDWISAQLDKSTRGTEHAFVFSHRGLMGANHVDGTFGSNPGSKSSDQNVFYASLMDNDVKYMISGHDHIHNRALVDSPDGYSQVEQLISQGSSSKFYEPGSIDSFIGYYGDVKQRETQISQEINNIGYYIYTVDGSRVTVDYYSDAIGDFQDGSDYPDGTGSLLLPDFDFVKKETWGYSQNGQQFLIAQGDSYEGIEDSFGETTAKILAGTNNSTSTDFTPYDYDDDGNPYNGPRALNKTVNTGWVAKPCVKKHCYKYKGKKKCKYYYGQLKSDILSLWGMSELDAEGLTDEYVLSMSFDFRRMIGLGFGRIGIATYVDGKWVNAVDENIGDSEKKFVIGPYKAKYDLGTYGIDPKTKTAWAVLDYNADFAVAKNIKPAPRRLSKWSKWFSSLCGK